jgi:glycosyltransferase involved in cell wall biosynthesis
MKPSEPDIVFITYCIDRGGAAAAARRILEAILEFDPDINVALITQRTPIAPPPKQMEHIAIQRDYPTTFLINFSLDYIARKILRTFCNKQEFLSTGILGVNIQKLLKKKSISINKTTPILVQWFNEGLLSTNQLAKLSKKFNVSITAHDSWLIHAPHHYESKTSKFTKSVFNTNKVKAQKPKIICPSNWLKKTFQDEGGWSTHVIPNPSDKKFITQYSKKKKEISEDISIGFLGSDSIIAPRKGFKHIIKASHSQNLKNSTILLAGSYSNTEKAKLGRPYKDFGKIQNHEDLLAFYRECDIILLPSEQENLSNVAIEANLLGKPVICWNIGGNADIVYHQHNGYIANAFDIHDFTEGVNYCRNNLIDMSFKSWETSQKKYNPKTIGAKYMTLINNE